MVDQAKRNQSLTYMYEHIKKAQAKKGSDQEFYLAGIAHRWPHDCMCELYKPCSYECNCYECIYALAKNMFFKGE